MAQTKAVTKRTNKKRPPNTTHTSPERSGEANIAKATPRQLKPDVDSLNSKLIPVYKKSVENTQLYKGLWTVPQLETAVAEFFDYCCERELKPTVPLLILWIGLSRQQFDNWRSQPQHSDKFVVIEKALLIMESYLQGQIEKYPTGSIFLLKTTHGHVERSQVDVNSTNATSAVDVQEAIRRLGLDS